LAELAAGTHSVAFVFGSERFGLSNEDLYTCHASVSIPTDPRYGSLNLSQAVQLIAYDWRQALGGFAVAARADAGLRADAAAIRGLLAHWQEALTALGFLDLKAPRKLMARLYRLANRAELSAEEVQILRGIARAMEEHSR
jgi:tRNA/rRNA methyltransferase